MLLDLVPLWAGVLALSVLMYVLLDGFDLGVGMLFFFHRDEAERDRMIASVSPVWDFNETWLVLGGTLLLAAFPGAFSVVVPAVYFPVLAMLLGLLFRGVAFEFRGVAGARKTVWSRAFAIGSLVATAAQGVVLGMFVQGFEGAHGRFVGTSWDWVAPFPLVTGAGLVAGYLLLGATWLVLKTDGTLQRAADAIAHATSDIAHGNHDLSRRTDEHAAGLQQTASSREPLAATVRTNADHARQASALALAASTQAEQGDAAARDAIARMEALSVRSQQIRSISSTIEGIAFQTNLLALNAAVAAARAGQAGRGFAVVAQEVRGLAHSSAQAAKEISALIADVTGDLELGADTVKAAGSTIVGMLASVRQVATLVDEISHASDEQRSGIDQVSRAVAQMDEKTQHNALLVQKAAGAAGALADEAAALREAAAIFRVVA